MKDRKKQIEEITKVIMGAIQGETHLVAPANVFEAAVEAEALYNAGYQNCKDKVVLSKEEYEKLLNKECLRGWIWKEGFNDGKEVYSEQLAQMRDTIKALKAELELKSKETAEKFAREMFSWLEEDDIDGRNCVIEVAKQFDVEIKE